MESLVLGYISLLLVLIAGIFHVRRVWQGIIVISPVSWFIWFAVSFAILLSYGSMNTKHEYYVAIGNVLFPGINFFLSFRQKTKVVPDGWDWGALTLGIVSISIWWFVRNDPTRSQYANYIAIVADMCALIPTFRMVRKNPMIEKPLPWILFALGFALSTTVIEHPGVANYILPVYMFCGSISIAYLQIRHRQKFRIQEKWY
jgi:hypothetical protein